MQALRKSSIGLVAGVLLAVLAGVYWSAGDRRPVDTPAIAPSAGTTVASDAEPPATADPTRTVLEPDPDPRPVEPAPLDAADASGAASGADAATAATTGTDAFTVSGRVLARGGQPIAAASVAIVLEQDGRRRQLARASTDADGRYAAAAPDIDALDARARAQTRIVATARASGRQPQTKRPPLAPHTGGAESAGGTAPRSLTIDFELSEGREVAGRILDAQGQAVAGADVALVVAGVQSGRRVRSVSAEVTSDADGRFAVGFVSAGHYELAARADGVGSAHVELDLVASADHGVGDVVLRGTGFLSGHARYPDGKPAPDLELWAIPEDVAREGKALIETVRRAPLEERGDGLFFGRATTDAAGRFEITGLKPGTYALRPPRPNVVFEPRQGHYAAGTENIELTIDCYRLRVRVRDPAGRPITGAVVTCTEMSQLSDGALEPGRAMHATAGGADAIATFEVEPETQLALTATAHGGRPAEDLVLLAQNEYELTRDLVIEPTGAPGRLRVVVRGPSGEELSGYEVSLLSARTGRRVEDSSRLSVDARGWLAPIPAGSYQVEVSWGDAARSGPSYYFPIRSRQVVEVESERTREVFLDAQEGGRLEVDLALTGRVPEDFNPPADSADPAANARAAGTLLRSRGAALRLRAADGSVRTLQFLVPDPALEGQIVIESLLLPGDRAPVEALLEPGRYTLEVDALGFRHTELPVAITAGKTTEVRVPLEAP